MLYQCGCFRPSLCYRGLTVRPCYRGGRHSGFGESIIPAFCPVTAYFFLGWWIRLIPPSGIHSLKLMTAKSFKPDCWTELHLNLLYRLSMVLVLQMVEIWAKISTGKIYNACILTEVPGDRNFNFSTATLKSCVNSTFLWIFWPSEGSTPRTTSRVSFNVVLFNILSCKETLNDFAVISFSLCIPEAGTVRYSSCQIGCWLLLNNHFQVLP